MMNRNRGFIGTCAALVLIGGLIGWTAVSRHDRTWTESESDFGAPRSLDELNSWAPVIVVAVAGDAHQASVDIASGAGGSVTSRRIDEVRSFKIERVLKQDRSLPSEIDVRVALSMKLWEESEKDATTVTYDRVPVVVGRRYVLFLGTFSRTTTGDALGYAGPLAVAEVQASGARFLVSDGLAKEFVPAFAREHVAISAIEQTIRAPKPTPISAPASSGDPNSIYAKPFATLIEQASTVKSVADGERLLTQLGMAPGSLQEPLFCRKVEAVLYDISGHQVNMKCR